MACTPPAQKEKMDDLASADPYYDVLLKGITRGFPGIIMAVQNGEDPVWTGSAGYADVENKILMKENDRFHIASITKLFTSIATLQLIDQGKLDFDHLVIQHLEPSLVNEIPNMEQINVGQLLDHSSGIYSFNNDLDYLNTIIGTRAFDGIRWSARSLLQLAYGSRADPQGEPGSGNYYSDVNQILLALIIEKITGRPFREVVYTAIIAPLGLRNTGFYSDSRSQDRYEKTTTVQGYIKRSDILDEFISIHPSFVETSTGLLNTTTAIERIDASAGMVSTARDLAMLGQALYKGNLVSSESLAWLYAIGNNLDQEALHTTRQGIVTVRNKPYGLIYTSLGDGTGGMNTMLAYHPESETVAVAFTNVFGNFDEHDYFIDSLVHSIIELGEAKTHSKEPINSK